MVPTGDQKYGIYTVFKAASQVVRLTVKLNMALGIPFLVTQSSRVNSNIQNVVFTAGGSQSQ